MLLTSWKTNILSRGLFPLRWLFHATPRARKILHFWLIGVGFLLPISFFDLGNWSTTSQRILNKSNNSLIFHYFSIPQNDFGGRENEFPQFEQFLVSGGGRNLASQSRDRAREVEKGDRRREREEKSRVYEEVRAIPSVFPSQLSLAL